MISTMSKGIGMNGVLTEAGVSSRPVGSLAIIPSYVTRILVGLAAVAMDISSSDSPAPHTLRSMLRDSASPDLPRVDGRTLLLSSFASAAFLALALARRSKSIATRYTCIQYFLVGIHRKKRYFIFFFFPGVES